MNKRTHSKEALRLWLRLLPCVSMVEGVLRTRFREQFSFTLPQFDVLAELDRAGQPQTMSEISRKLLVTSGNVTGLIDRLERGGYVVRRPSPSDRRVQYVELSEKGRQEFAAMAKAHEQWLAELFADFPEEDVAQLSELLGRAKSQLRTRVHSEEAIA
jgi:DNA-binding MarR family transcriptional regulator